MATLSLTDAKVRGNGRLLLTDFTVSPQPASHGLPDWKPGVEAEKQLLLNGVIPLTPRGISSFDFNIWQLGATTTSGGTVPAGSYFYRLVLVDGNGVEQYVSSLGGEWDASKYPLVLTANASLVFTFHDAIPTGYTGRIYLNTDTSSNDYAAMAASLRLFRDGIAAGATGLTATNATFANASQSPTTVRRWVVEWEIPEASIVPYLATGLTITGESGLIVDEHSNLSGAFTNYPVTNGSKVGSNGRTSDSFETLTDASVVKYYVSEEYGDDDNDGLTELTAFASTDHAFEIAETREAGAVFLLEGEVFGIRTTPLMRRTPTNTLRFGEDNSPARPFILGTYFYDYGQGTAGRGTRPTLRFKDTDICAISSSNADRWQGWIWRDIHFKIEANDSNRYESIGVLKFLGTARNITLDNCDFEGVQIGFIQDRDKMSTDILINRCKFRDGKISEALSGSTDDRQAIFFHGPMGALISQCTFDNCSYRIANSDGQPVRPSTNRNHAMYVQNRSEGTTVWGCTFSRVCSDGTKLRGGGHILRNLYVGNGLDTNGMRHGVWMHGNVHMNGDPNQAQGTVWGDDSTSWHHCNHAVVEFGIFAHCDSGEVGQAITPQCNTSTNKIRRYGLIRHCVVLDHNTCVKALTGPPGVSFIMQRNILIQDRVPPTGSTYYIYQLLRQANQGSYPGNLDFDENAMYSLGSVPFQIQQSSGFVTTLDGVRGLGLETNSLLLATPPTFVDSTYNVADWSAEVGGPATYEGWLTSIRDREIDEWEPWQDGAKAFDYFAAAYKSTSLPLVNTSEIYGFYGALSPAPDIPGLDYDIVGSDTGAVGVPMVLSLAPTNLTSDSVALSANLAGAFSATTHTFDGSANAFEFTFTPSAAGSLTITATRTSGSPGTIATHNATVPVPGTGTGKTPWDVLGMFIPSPVGV